MSDNTAKIDKLETCPVCGGQAHMLDEIARLQAENAELVMSLEWAVSEIGAKTRYTKENQFGKCLARANETLAKHKKD